MYGLYKQATVGDVNIECPSSVDFIGLAKWKSWKSYSGMSESSVFVRFLNVEMQKLSISTLLLNLFQIGRS